jgi:hypothetical protein
MEKVRTNASFVSYMEHAAALLAIQAHFPDAFLNGTMDTANGWQLITTPYTPQKQLNKCAAVRKLRKLHKGHPFPTSY